MLLSRGGGWFLVGVEVFVLGCWFQCYKVNHKLKYVLYFDSDSDSNFDSDKKKFNFMSFFLHLLLMYIKEIKRINRI